MLSKIEDQAVKLYQQQIGPGVLWEASPVLMAATERGFLIYLGKRNLHAIPLD